MLHLEREINPPTNNTTPNNQFNNQSISCVLKVDVKQETVNCGRKPVSILWVLLLEEEKQMDPNHVCYYSSAPVKPQLYTQLQPPDT